VPNHSANSLASERSCVWLHVCFRCENVSALRKKNKRKKRGKPQTDLRRSSGESDGLQGHINGETENTVDSELVMKNEVSKTSVSQVICYVYIING